MLTSRLNDRKWRKAGIRDNGCYVKPTRKCARGAAAAARWDLCNIAAIHLGLRRVRMPALPIQKMGRRSNRLAHVERTDRVYPNGT